MTNKTEQIKREWLQFVDTLPKYVGQTPKNVIADWWLQKLSEQRQAIIEEVEGLRKEKPPLIAENIEARLLVSCYNEAIDTVIKIINR